LLKELAQLVDVDYFEDDRGALIVSTNGHILVSGAKSHDLLMRRTDVMEQDGYQYSKVEVSFALTGSEFKPKHGELRALMDIRDIDVPKYEEYINSVAQSLITEVNKVHQNGYSLSGLTFIEFFDSDPSKFSAAGIQLSAAVKKDINNIAAGVGGKVTPSNNLFDIPQLTPDPPGNVQVLDLTTIDEHYRYIHKNSLVIKDIDGNLLQEGKDYDINYFTAQITFKYSATNAFGEASNQISVSFDYSQTGYGGPGDGDNALAISQLRDKALMQSDVFGNSTQTINQFYSGMLGRLGVERNEAEAGLDTRTFALQQLLEQQQQIMGVNIDEEMANMIRYEHTYVASARYLSTINSMLDTLLNM
jgi:flagellar hook-associated protein FlgK